MWSLCRIAGIAGIAIIAGIEYTVPVGCGDFGGYGDYSDLFRPSFRIIRSHVRSDS